MTILTIRNATERGYHGHKVLTVALNQEKTSRVEANSLDSMNTKMKNRKDIMYASCLYPVLYKAKLLLLKPPMVMFEDLLMMEIGYN